MNQQILDHISLACTRPEVQAKFTEWDISNIKVTAEPSSYTYGTNLVISFDHPWTAISLHPYVVIPVELFPGCCGVQVIHHVTAHISFGYDPETYKVKTLLRKGITTLFFSLALEALRAYPPCGILLGTTNRDQTTLYAAWLERLGWFQVGDVFNNPNTHLDITTWRYNLR